MGVGRNGSAQRKKRGPGEPGPFSLGGKLEGIEPESTSLSRALASSETEPGQVAVARGDAGARGQCTVDGGHQSGEQGAGGYEADGCSLGHLCPLF